MHSISRHVQARHQLSSFVMFDLRWTIVLYQQQHLRMETHPYVPGQDAGWFECQIQCPRNGRWCNCTNNGQSEGEAFNQPYLTDNHHLRSHIQRDRHSPNPKVSVASLKTEIKMSPLPWQRYASICRLYLNDFQTNGCIC